MSLFVVVEILNEDGSEVTDDGPLGREFDIAQLKIMEADRRADGYINLDSTNYVFNAKIVGVAAQVDAEGFETDPVHRITPIDSAL